MEKLNLDNCKTNEEVCKLVSKRVSEISYADLLKEVDKKFVFQNKAVRAIYTGLSMNMNVFLSGPGGYGKSDLIKYVLNVYKIPYHSIIGYKDMPVDALLGIPNMDKLLKNSEYELNFKDSIFCKPGILIGEEFTDILPSTAAALKDILTERGFRDKKGKTESLIASMVIAANKSANDVVDDESKRAFYIDRFPIAVRVTWESYLTSDYFKLLKIVFPDKNDELLYFMAKLFSTNHEEYSVTISPRVAIDITTVFLNKGLSFISHFAINTDSIDSIRAAAKQEFNRKSVQALLQDLMSFIETIDQPKDYKASVLFAQKRLETIKVSDDLLMPVIEARNKLKDITKNDFLTINMRKIDEIFKQIEDDKTTPDS